MMRYIDVNWRENGIPTQQDIIDAAVAGWGSRSKQSYHELIKDVSYDECVSFLKRLIGWDHTSVLEHIVFKFIISVSRVNSHEFVRHRMASYTQSSYRTKREFEDEMFVVPPVIIEREFLGEWLEQMYSYIRNYNYWIDMGLGVDVARYHLPQGVRTSVAVTMNARSLRNFFVLRLDKRAHFEIRDTANTMLRLINDVGLGFLFEGVIDDKM